MRGFDDAAFDPDEETVEPFRVTPGFIGFLALLFLPFILALAVVIGAWVVADDVYAAERQPSAPDQSGFYVTMPDQPQEAAGWKRTLVSVCPLH